MANKKELAKTLSKFTYGGHEPWSKPFHEKFCKSCPTITAKPEGYHKEYDFHECDFVDGECPHGDMIEWWLNQEVNNDTVHN